MARISLKVNGKTQVVDVDPETPLLYVLRNDLQLNGPKFGCGLAQCGACTVIMNGNAIRSCVTQVSAAQNQPVTTLEGLGSTKKMHKIQQAFVDEQAVQCGYCINGMIMTSKTLLDKNPKPTDAQIKEALAGNLMSLRHAHSNSPCREARIGTVSLRSDDNENHGTDSQTIPQTHRCSHRQLQPHATGWKSMGAIRHFAVGRYRSHFTRFDGSPSRPTVLLLFTPAKSKLARARSPLWRNLSPRSSTFLSVTSRWIPATPRAPSNRARRSVAAASSEPARRSGRRPPRRAMSC